MGQKKMFLFPYSAGWYKSVTKQYFHSYFVSENVLVFFFWKSLGRLHLLQNKSVVSTYRSFQTVLWNISQIWKISGVGMNCKKSYYMFSKSEKVEEFYVCFRSFVYKSCLYWIILKAGLSGVPRSTCRGLGKKMEGHV